MNADRIHKQIAYKIRAARTNRGVSQQWLSDRIGLTRTSVVNIEMGRQRPPIVTLMEIAKHLGVHVRRLLPS